MGERAIMPKPGDIVEIKIGENPELGLRYIARFEVFRVYEDTNMYLFRVERIKQEKIQQCPHCGRYYDADK